MTDMQKLELQRAEFDAMSALADAYRGLPPIVDDDYPRMRNRYERALRFALVAFMNNGRFDVEYVSIIQQWAAHLGLRHQGVLVSAIRGCDSVPREDPSKYLVRVFRGVLLRPHCKDLAKAASFMVPFDAMQWDHSEADFLRSIDHYPNHWLLHWIHACQVVGYKHPDYDIRLHFSDLYQKVIRKFHLNPETEEQLDRRLNADEKTFAKEQV